MNKNYKIMFFLTLTAGTMISISSYSLLGMWIGLEINLLSMIPIMQEKLNMISTESSIKYFCVQAMASSILIMSMIMLMTKTGMLSTVEESPFMWIMNSSLLTKMGMTPFHFWFPEVMEGLSWMNCLIMMTWQKLAPMVLVMYNMMFPLFTEIIIMAGLLISSIMSFNQVSMRKLLAYSSINHMSWMISSMMMMQTIWLYYFLVYSFLTINLTAILKLKNISSLNQMYLTLNTNNLMKLLFMANFINLSGLPPFLGFMVKWMIIQAMMTKTMFLLSMVMVLSTIMMIFIYLKISMTSLILNTDQTSWNTMTNSSNSFYSMLLNSYLIGTLIMMTMIFNSL